MFSPINQNCAIVYYPPAAHIETVRLSSVGWELPSRMRHWTRRGHPEASDRAAAALGALKDFYPELGRSSVISSHFTIAVNTTANSRIRRNLGVWEILPGCTATVPPKWTMAVANAREDLSLALRRSVSTGNVAPDESRALLRSASEQRAWQTRPPWAGDPEATAAVLEGHARNMGVPQELALPNALDALMTT
jgi:hypothetical protein